MRKGKLRTIAVALFAVAVVASVGLVLHDGRDAVTGVLGQPRSVPYLLAGIAASAVGVVLGYWAWIRVLSGLGSSLPTPAGIRLFFVGFLGKFIPGRVWGVVAQAELGVASGVPRRRMAATYLVNLSVVLLTGGLVALLVAPALLGAHALWLAVPAVLTAVVVARPQLVDIAAAFIARSLRRQGPRLTGAGTPLRQAIGAQMLAWPVSGLHVWLLAMLMGAAPLPAMPVAIGGFALAMIAGTAAVFAPDGVGVRELVLITALTAVLPLPEAGMAAIASRLISTLGELAAAGPMLLFVHRKKGTVPSRV